MEAVDPLQVGRQLEAAMPRQSKAGIASREFETSQLERNTTARWSSRRSYPDSRMPPHPSDVP